MVFHKLAGRMACSKHDHQWIHVAEGGVTLNGKNLEAGDAGIVDEAVSIHVTAHAANGFFMNWFGNQKGEGFEYHLLAIGLALVVMIQGAGKASLDGLIVSRIGT
jgi:uncharacterized membrane protein